MTASYILKEASIDDQIMHTWALCSGTFFRHKCRFRFPENTPPSKTYLWRGIKKLHDMFNEFGFNDDAKIAYVEAAMNLYAHKVRSMGINGISLLSKPSYVNRCLDKMEEMSGGKEFDELLDTFNFLCDKSLNNDFKSLLLSVSSDGFNRNIVKWYLSGRINIDYMSLSLSCLHALNSLELEDFHQRSIVPSNPVIDAHRYRLLSAKTFTDSAKKILKFDWRQL